MMPMAGRYLLDCVPMAKLMEVGYKVYAVGALMSSTGQVHLVHH